MGAKLILIWLKLLNIQPLYVVNNTSFLLEFLLIWKISFFKSISLTNIDPKIKYIVKVFINTKNSKILKTIQDQIGDKIQPLILVD